MFSGILSEKAGIFERNICRVFALCPMKCPVFASLFTAKVILSKAFFEICQLIVTTMQSMTYFMRL
jgi:hypothetical protein